MMAVMRLRRPNQVSIHELEEVLRLGTPYEVVFGTLPRAAGCDGTEDDSAECLTAPDRGTGMSKPPSGSGSSV